MKLGRVVLASAVMGASGLIAFGQQQPQPATAPTIAQAPGADVTAIAQGVRRAADPSSAVAAYAAAVAQVGINPVVEDAYVRRMVEFNLPDMAESQAQDVVKQDPSNDVARAVVAYMQGRRGEAVDALAMIVQTAGGDKVVTDAFVLRTAGQLVAWYDTRADKAQVADQLKTDVEAMRRKLSAQDTYSLAYGAARDAYQGKTAADQPQQQPLQPQPSASTYEPVVETPVPTETYSPPPAYDYSYSTTYPYPYGYSGYAYQPYYPYSYWSGYRRYPAYDPTCVPPVIIPRGHHHGHNWSNGNNWHGGHDDHDDHHDGNHGPPGGGGHGGGGGGGGLEPRVHQYDDVRTTRNRNGTVVAERAIEPTPIRTAVPPASKGRIYQDMQEPQQPRQQPPAPAQRPKEQPQQQPRQQRPQADAGKVSRAVEAPARTERKPDPPAAARPAPSAPPQQRSNDRSGQQQQQQPRQAQPSGDRKTR